MRSMQQINVTLPSEIAEIVRAKVSSGEYETESEVIYDGLRALLSRNRVMEEWLRQSVVPAYDGAKENPSGVRSPRMVRAALAAEHQQRLAQENK